MKDKKSLIATISDIDSTLKSNKYNISNYLHESNVKKPCYCNDKTAVEDYKNMKAELSDLNFGSSSCKLAYLQIRVSDYHINNKNLH